MPKEKNKDTPILHIRVHPFIFKVLRKSGAKSGRGPHLEAKKLLLDRMWEKQMLPEGNIEDIIAELFYGIKQKERKNGLG